MIGSIGFPELLIILAIALIIFGPKKLPEVGRSLGRALKEFRKTSDEIRERIEEEIEMDDVKEIKRDLEDIKNFDPMKPSKAEKKESNKNEEGKKVT